jgi:hypothetical protein
VFDIAPEKLQPPLPVYAGGRRDFEGAYSWLATVTPELDATATVRDTYLLSIVIFNRRDATYAMNLVSTVTPANELVVSVAAFHSSGYGGGDVTLQSATKDELDLKPGNWVLLMGNLTTSVSGLSNIGVFRWYQVAAADLSPADDDSDGLYEMDVTLQGSDWPLALTTANTTQVGLFANVVGVYEKSIRLQHSGLWAP